MKDMARLCLCVGNGGGREISIQVGQFMKSICNERVMKRLSMALFVLLKETTMGKKYLAVVLILYGED